MAATDPQAAILDKLLQEMDGTTDLGRQEEVATFLIDHLAARRLEVTFGRGKKNDLRPDIAKDTDKVVAALLGRARWPGNEAGRETFMRMAIGQMEIQRDLGFMCLDHTLPAIVDVCQPITLGQMEANLTDMLVAAGPELTQANYDKIRGMSQSLSFSAGDAFMRVDSAGPSEQVAMRTHVLHNFAKLLTAGYKPA